MIHSRWFSTGKVDEATDWLIEKTIKFRKVFSKIIK